MHVVMCGLSLPHLAPHHSSTSYPHTAVRPPTCGVHSSRQIGANHRAALSAQCASPRSPRLNSLRLLHPYHPARLCRPAVSCKSSNTDSSSTRNAGPSQDTPSPTAAAAEATDADADDAGSTAHHAAAEAAHGTHDSIRSVADSRREDDSDDDDDARTSGDDEEEDDDDDDNDDGIAVSDLTDTDSKLEEVLRDNTLSASVLDLAATMFSVGLQGSGALGLGYLLLHRSLLDSFRWTAADVETGLLWALPAIAFGALVSVLPLPTHKQLMNTAAAAAAAGEGAGASSSSSTISSSGGGGDDGDVDVSRFEAFNDARRMATNAALAGDIPVRVTLLDASSSDDDDGGSSRSDERLLTRLSLHTATQALRYMQEFVAEPWSLKTNSLQTWAVGVCSATLQRLSVELFWRGLVAAGLAGWLYSTWETAGTSQDSPLFYARLFGLLTPQASLAVISLILLATRLPADVARTQPAVVYTRLASMEVEVVGRLTEEDWLAMVLPAEVAAAAAQKEKQSASLVTRNTTLADLTDFLQTEKVQLFGRLKQDTAVGASSSSGSSREQQHTQQQQQQHTPQQQQKQQQRQPMSKQEMEQELERLLSAVQDWKRSLNSSNSSSSTDTSSSGSSSSSSHSAAASKPSPQGFDLSPQEQQAAELAADFLELVKASAAAKAAAAAASKSSYIAKSVGVSSSKLVTGLETLLQTLNSNPQRRLFLLHLPDGGVGNSSSSRSSRGGGGGSSGSEGDGDSDDDDSSDDDDDEVDSTPAGSVQAVLKAKARTAAEELRNRGGVESSTLLRQRRVDESTTSSSSSSSTAKQQDSQGGDESMGSLLDALEKQQQQQEQEKQRATSSSTSSSSSSTETRDKNSKSGSSSSSSKAGGGKGPEGPPEGLDFEELPAFIKQQLEQLQAADGPGSSGDTLQRYLAASKGAYRVAANLPTAQDSLARALLTTFCLLEQLSVVGAFVASTGNLAASLSAAAAVGAATVTLQQAVGQRERGRVRRAVGPGWPLKFQMFVQD